MSGVQCANCGRVGPVKDMAYVYEMEFGTESIEPAYNWVHIPGKGCNKA
jgi:hypothetical protein